MSRQIKLHEHPFPLTDADVLMRSLRLERAAQLGLELEEKIRAAERIEPIVFGETAVLRIAGPIEYRLSFWGWIFGGTSVVALSKAFQGLIDSPDVRRIVFDVDSPGGSYPGVPELSKQIYDQRAAKDIIAVANPYAASAAVWIASATGRFYVTQSGSVGSVGAYSLLVSFARQLKEEGIDVEVVRNPKYKGESNPYEAITDERREFAQQQIDVIADEFVRAVATHRGKSSAEVREKFGQGRMLMAKEAKDVGLVEGISTVDREVGKSRRGRPPGTRAATMGISDRVRKPSPEPFFVGHSPQPKGTR